jgi:hypothetical protein
MGLQGISFLKSAASRLCRACIPCPSPVHILLNQDSFLWWLYYSPTWIKPCWRLCGIPKYSPDGSLSKIKYRYCYCDPWPVCKLKQYSTWWCTLARILWIQVSQLASSGTNFVLHDSPARTMLLWLLLLWFIPSTSALEFHMTASSPSTYLDVICQCVSSTMKLVQVIPWMSCLSL